MPGNALVFGAIPVIWWTVFHRKKESLARFMGLYKPKREAAAWWMIAVFAVVYLLNYNFGEDIITLFLSEESHAAITGGAQESSLTGAGIMGLPAAAITNLVCNGFFEEFLYRGFILKRFKKLTNSRTFAIIMTAVLFGLMHNALYLVAGLQVKLDYHIAMFIYTAIGALLLGFANEKLYNGSIWPSIILQGVGNFFSAIVVLFNPYYIQSILLLPVFSTQPDNVNQEIQLSQAYVILLSKCLFEFHL